MRSTTGPGRLRPCSSIATSPCSWPQPSGFTRWQRQVRAGEGGSMWRSVRRWGGWVTVIWGDLAWRRMGRRRGMCTCTCPCRRGRMDLEDLIDVLGREYIYVVESGSMLKLVTAYLPVSHIDMAQMTN
ncbi:uncharacterized protein A4U43_C03F30510 [Asparagus officinalis]|uniref:Uncharacterized protein n=1 Tax=Asparagus officinalis TaxID=4686 RepID=A0A5P1FGW5_ASPOF|nr:uncharacterized protein A4U43_C03F30510 [Asparagus officinalis]